MLRRFLPLLLIPLAACDSSGDDARDFDLAFYGTDGAFLARIEFEEPAPLPCDALYCNEADWELVDGAPQGPVTLGQSRGTLRAAPTEDGWSLNLVPGADDSGTSAIIGIAPDGDVTGTWTQITVAGPLPGGTVEGRAE